MTNFLNIGNNYIISANKELKNIVKNSGIKIKFVELSPILNIGGAVHRITQVSRNISIKKVKNKDIKLVILYIIIFFIIMVVSIFFIKKICCTIKNKKIKNKELEGKELEDKELEEKICE